jgi:hypothetical protein
LLQKDLNGIYPQDRDGRKEVFRQFTDGELEFAGANNGNLVGLDPHGELLGDAVGEILAVMGKIP